MKKQFGVIALVAMFGFASIAYAAMTGVLVPNTDGTYQSWVPVNSPGGTHHKTVDESNCNGTTDYVFTATTSTRDSYGIDISSIPDGSTVTKIHIRPCASKNSAVGSSTLDVFGIFNGVQGPDKGSYVLAGTVPSVLATTTFQNVNMLKASTSTLEIGGVYTSGNAGVRMSKIYTVVEYTP